MRIRQKKVSYCDFCKKHSLRSLTIHEKHCTANPNRICRLCGRTDINTIIPKYKIDILPEWFKNPNTIEGTVKAEIDEMVEKKIYALRTEVGNCPICILTVIRLNKYKWPINPNYDFKKELNNWWEAQNTQEEDMY